MTFTIPVWILWTVGILVGGCVLVVLCALAWVGYCFLRSWSDFKGW